MLRVKCECQKFLVVGEEYAGKRIRCAACKRTVDVPGRNSQTRLSQADALDKPSASTSRQAEPSLSVSRPSQQPSSEPINEQTVSIQVSPGIERPKKSFQLPGILKSKRALLAATLLPVALVTVGLLVYFGTRKSTLATARKTVATALGQEPGKVTIPLDSELGKRAIAAADRVTSGPKITGNDDARDVQVTRTSEGDKVIYSVVWSTTKIAGTGRRLKMGRGYWFVEFKPTVKGKEQWDCRMKGEVGGIVTISL